MYTHICVEIVCELPLLPSNTARETFLHELEQYEVLTYHWDTALAVTFSNSTSSNYSYFHGFFPIMFLMETFIRNIIILCINYKI